MQLTWFRQPAGDDPGSLNLCFNAVDRHVVHGHAERTAVHAEARTIDFATLVEETAALAGSMRSLGVGPGMGVASRLEEGVDRLLTLLAALRLGAVFVEGDRPGEDPQLLIEPGAVRPALQAGRIDPAPCEALPPSATAYVVDGQAVTVADAVGHPTWPGIALATLCGGATIAFGSDVAETA